MTACECCHYNQCNNVEDVADENESSDKENGDANIFELLENL